MTDIREAQYQRLVRQAYNEGFTEGMKEHTSRDGGKPWQWSDARKALDVLSPQDTRHD